MADSQNDPKWRKQRPLFSGVLMYFPDALREVAHCSYMGNEQHHPGEPLHWDRSKSTDEADALMRHLLESGTVDTDGVRHTAKVAWRALALLQKEIETERLTTQPVDKAEFKRAFAQIAKSIGTTAPNPPGLRKIEPDEWQTLVAHDFDKAARWDGPDYWGV